MKNFLKKIEEIESTFKTLDSEIRAELLGAEQALADAQTRLTSLETRYQVELVKGGQDASRLKIELEVARDRASLIEAKAGQLRQELEAGEIVDAQLQRHAAVCAAVEGEGNAAIAQAVQAAERARDAYQQAVQGLVRIQHAVAEIGRRSYSVTAKLGKPLTTPTVARYVASEFTVAEPEESHSTTPFM